MKASMVSTTLIAVALAGCAPTESSNQAHPPATDPTKSPDSYSTGEGSQACPAAKTQAEYTFDLPERQVVVQSIPRARYLLTGIRAVRVEIKPEQGWSFVNGTKVIPETPGKITPTDPLQALIKNPNVPLMTENLSFPLSFRSIAGQEAQTEIVWESFATLKPDVETKSPGRIGHHKIETFDSKLLNEDVSKYSFNVFKKYTRFGYQKPVKWSDTDYGMVTGRVSFSKIGGGSRAPSEVRFYIYLQKTSGTESAIDTKYELTYRTEKQAVPASCGPNASAVLAAK